MPGGIPSSLAVPRYFYSSELLLSFWLSSRRNTQSLPLSNVVYFIFSLINGNLGIPNAFIFIYIVLINYTPFVETTFDPFKIYDLAKTLFSGILLNFIICTQLWPRWEADKLRYLYFLKE